MENKLNKKNIHFDLGEVIYNNRLIDIPKIMDLSVLYGYGNTGLMRELITRIFVLQPSYFKDLSQSVSYIANAFSLNGEGSNLDRIRYLYDTTFTLRSLLDLFPLASFAFLQPLEQYNQRPFVQQLGNFYEVDLVTLENALTDDKSKFQIDQIRLNILAICDAIMTECYFDNPLIPLLKNKANNNNNQLLLLQDALYKKYLQTYFITPHDSEQLEDVEQRTHILFEFVIKQMDFVDDIISDYNSLASFITSALKPTEEGLFLAHYDRIYNLSHTLRQIRKQQLSNKGLEDILDLLEKLQVKYKFIDNEENEQIDEKVLKLQEVFPDYGTGFIQLVLDYFDGNSDRAVSALLEDNVPESLQDFDRSMTLRQLQHEQHSLVKKAPKPVSLPSQSPLSEEVSPMVWENADFFGSVHIGKKNKNKEVLQDMLDDGLRQRIVETYMYDDEYDDSYDDVANFDVGEGNAVEDDEALDIVKQQLPVVNANRQPKQQRHKLQQPQEQNIPTAQPESSNPKSEISSTVQRREVKLEQQKGEQGENVGRGRGKGYKKEQQRGEQSENVGRGRGRGYGQNKANKQRRKNEGRKEMIKLFGSNQPQ